MATKEHLRLDREALPRDVDSDDDSEWLDDPIAKGLQPMNAAAAAMPGGSAAVQQLCDIKRPDHVSPETHDLVLKTMLGSESWAATKATDDALVALRYRRMAELRLRAAQGGADGRAAALVAAELEDLDGERLVRQLSTQDVNDAVRHWIYDGQCVRRYLCHADICLAPRTSEAREFCGFVET